MTDQLRLRPLTPHDEPCVQELIESDPDYAHRISGHAPMPGDARELLTERPAEVTDDRKVVLGGFEQDALVAVIDLLRGWPDPATTHIGLLQVHARHKGQGSGRRVHELVLAWVRNWPETTTLRAAIVETNADQAAPFWAAMGYTPTPDTPLPFHQGTVSTTVTIWSRSL